MLSCEKSVGGIPTRRTLSLQLSVRAAFLEGRRRRRRGERSTRINFPRSPFSPTSLPFFIPKGGRRETTVSEERDEPPEQHESLRTSLRCERNASSPRMLACFEYVNIFYSTLSLGHRIKLFLSQGCHPCTHCIVTAASRLASPPRVS